MAELDSDPPGVDASAKSGPSTCATEAQLVPCGFCRVRSRGDSATNIEALCSR